jgi:general secretion pathway protein A
LYKGFYKLKEDPFRLTPDPAFLYMTAQHREAFSGLVYSVCTRPGLTVLVGEAGTGKTTLLYTLAALLEKRRFITAMCTNPTLTREEFYDLLLIKLGVQCASPLKSRQLVALQETLLRNRAGRRPSVLIVDEAQRLSPEVLEEIRLLLNLETPREKLLEIIVAGQPELTEIFRRSELRQLKQRVSCICKLEPLSPEDLWEYLRFRLTRAGLPEQTLFPKPVIQVLYEYTQGIPRLVNTLCDAALRTGFALQSPTITPSIVREAAKDLELAPSLPLDHLPLNGADRAIASSIETPAVPVESVAHGSAAEFGPDGNGTAESRIPLADYAGRQREQGFLAGLRDRWR